MKLNVRRRSEKFGLPPGSLVHVGEQRTAQTKITIMVYNQEELEEYCVTDVEEALRFRDIKERVAWINIEGLEETSVVERIGTHFGLHPLLLEDILNTTIRPKQEDSLNHISIIMRMILPTDPHSASSDDETVKGIPISSEQVALVCGKGWLLTFQETHGGDAFDRVRQRIRSNTGRIRMAGADYLTYALIDAIVDGYFAVLERLGEEIEALEEQVTQTPTTLSLQEIHNIRRFALTLRRSIWPVRDILSAVERDHSPLITDATRVFFRDVYDHSVEMMDMLEAFREMVAGLMELYLSCTSNRMNSIMMVLTVATVIFMPLTFIAGIYGMNFEYMPELQWRYGYPMVIGIMLVVAGAMLLVFRRKNWI